MNFNPIVRTVEHRSGALQQDYTYDLFSFHVFAVQTFCGPGSAKTGDTWKSRCSLILIHMCFSMYTTVIFVNLVNFSAAFIRSRVFGE